jgi:hypothetical protein
MNFSGAITSDFMKLANIPLSKRPTFIDFAATDFLSVRKSLIDYVRAVYPLEYQYFAESDLGMMLIELVAYMGSVMSMKADMLANENFLATSKQRSSVKKLLELIGIRMRGPLSAAADAQIIFTESPVGGVPYIISPANRTTDIVSPEDNAAVTYTLYKVVNGFADTANSTGQIELYEAESDNSSDTSTVYSNLVLQEGSLVTDSGYFAATEALKGVKLTQSPVVEGSVEVFVNSTDSTVQGAYTEVNNIYFASGSSDRIFEIVYDENYAATVVFGDGTVGVSPDDTASYFTTYRIGGGTRGNILPNTISTTINATSDSAARLGTLSNTTPATGGSNAETVEHVKKWGPLNFRRQDRLVTLEDYSVFANTFISTFGTIGKATAATRKAYSSGNIIDIYILEKASDIQLQKATPNFKTQLLTQINKKKMITDEAVIVDGLIRTLDLVVTIRIDKSEEANESQIVSKVRDKVLIYMNADNRDFGDGLIISELNRNIFEIDEVRYSTIDNLDQDVGVDFNEIIQLNNLTINTTLLD